LNKPASSPFNRHLLVTAAALIALVAANLALTAAMLWLIEEGYPAKWVFFRNQFHQFAWGLLLSQVILVGYWLGLGDGRWYLRLVAAIALTLAIALALHWAERLSPRARRHGNESPWAILSFVLIAMMLVVSCVGFVLRRTRGWRLTWRSEVPANTIHQFQIADGLLWMIVIGGALAALRFVFSIEDSLQEQLLDISLMTTSIATVVLIAMMTAFTTSRQLRKVVVMIVVVTAIGIAFAVPDIYRGVQRARAVVTGPIAWSVYVSNAIGDGLGEPVFVWAAMSGALANCLVLRLIGCRLIRPGNFDSSLIINSPQD